MTLESSSVVILCAIASADSAIGKCRTAICGCNADWPTLIRLLLSSLHVTSPYSRRKDDDVSQLSAFPMQNSISGPKAFCRASAIQLPVLIPMRQELTPGPDESYDDYANLNWHNG